MLIFQQNLKAVILGPWLPWQQFKILNYWYCIGRYKGYLFKCNHKIITFDQVTWHHGPVTRVNIWQIAIFRL